MAMIKLLEYTFDNTIDADCLPTFTGIGTTEVIDEVSGNITKRVINVEDSGMPTQISFNGKTALLTLDYINMSKVKHMINMFLGCSSLKTVNATNWGATNITHMGYAFQGCSSLEIVDFTNSDLSNVTSIYNLFYNCRKLKKINGLKLSSALTNMSSTFYNCESLTSLDILGDNICNVTTMNNVFFGCKMLEKLDVSMIKTNSTTNFNSAFYLCSSLTKLDISNFDLSKASATNNMFLGSTKLTDIGLLYSPTSTVNTIATLLPTTTSKKIYYQDTISSDLTPVNNVEFVEYVSNTISTNEVALRSLPNGVCDTLDLMTGEYIQRVGVREYQVGDESNSQVTTDKVNTRYELETPITTTIDLKQHPYAYKDGYINLSSNSKNSLTPSIEYSLPINRSGQVLINTQLVQKQQKQLDELESMIIANMVNTQYKQTLSNVEYMLGGE